MAAEDAERKYFRRASGEKADIVPIDMVKHPSKRWREWLTIFAASIVL
jgi:hypothetical protein